MKKYICASTPPTKYHVPSQEMSYGEEAKKLLQQLLARCNTGGASTDIQPRIDFWERGEKRGSEYAIVNIYPDTQDAYMELEVNYRYTADDPKFLYWVRLTTDELLEVISMLPKNLITNYYSQIAMNKILRSLKQSNKSGNTKYTIYVCNAESTMNRAPTGDTCEKFVEYCKDDREAGIMGLYHQQWCWIDSVEEIEQELGDEDPYEIFKSQDLGDGSPFVYGIKKGSKWIFKLEDIDIYNEDGELIDPFKI